MATRRRFLGVAAGTVMSATIGRQAWAAESKSEVPLRTLGHAGEKISMVGIGGYHLARPGLGAEESIRIVRTGLAEGINFLDNCWDYNGGESELRMGKALRDGYRQKAFLMTKIDGRNRATATSQINDSLKRPQTDRAICCNFRRSFVMPTRIEFSPPEARSRPRSRREKPARFATSDSPCTRVPTSI